MGWTFKSGVKEAISRFVQLIIGLAVFDFPILISARKFVFGIILHNVGRKCLFGRKISFYAPHGMPCSRVIIGDIVQIAANVEIDISAPVTIQDNVWISQDVRIFNHIHEVKRGILKKDQPILLSNGITLGNDCWIGAGTIILPRVQEIGEGAIVGAGSVVTRNVGKNEVVAGNPAKHIKFR